MKILNFLLLLMIGDSAHAMVNNPSVFVGEKIFGGSAGQPLSIDTAGTHVAVGLPYYNLVSSTASSCTTTNGTLNGMSGTPAAGTYLATFSADFSSPTSGLIVTLQLAVAGTLSAGSQRKFMPFAGGSLTAGSQRVVAGTTSIITVNGAQTVAVQCQTSTGTATTASMELDLVRLL